MLNPTGLFLRIGTPLLRPGLMSFCTLETWLLLGERAFMALLRRISKPRTLISYTPRTLLTRSYYGNSKHSTIIKRARESTRSRTSKQRSST
jgi:hypothetical protein